MRQVVVVCGSMFVTACVSTALSTSSPGSSSSDGNANVTIPNVFKLPKADAVAALRRAGVKGDIDDDTSVCGSTFDGKIVELGEVCYQQPAAGQTQGARLSVSLRVQTEDPHRGNVGQANEWRLMPDLVGKTYDQSLVELRRAGFNVDHIDRTPSDDAACKPGIVCSQYPSALVRAGVNDGKLLYVGAEPTGPKPTVATSDPAPRPAEPTHTAPATPAVSSPPAAPAEAKHWGGNGAPPYRDDEGRVHGPGGPVFMGKGVPCTEKLDHCMRPGVWFAADGVGAGKMFRAVPVFQFENTWWTWRGQSAEPKHLFRTSVVDKPDRLQVGKPVIFFSDDDGRRWLDNEYDMLTSSRWEVGVIDTISADSVHIQGWDNVPIETVRMIVEEKPQP